MKTRAALLLLPLVLTGCGCDPGDDTAARLAAPRSTPAATIAQPLLGTPAEDLLIQDVCVAADGRLLPDDPYDGCPSGATQRDLALGEPLPYHRHDQPGPGAPQGYQRHDAFPRPSPSGAGRRYVSPFDFAPFGEYNPDRDGYDVVEADGPFASIVGTRDPVGLAQTFFGPGCALDDSWLLFPTATGAGPGERVAQLILIGWERTGAAFPGRCPGRFDRSLTRWQERTVDFGDTAPTWGSRPKRIPALVVDHYGGATVETADHIERFYFTRPYGLTRWERWQRSGAPRPEGCNGATREGGFVRLDCRDWTHVVAEPEPYPPAAWPTPYADSNLVRNHDFGDGSATYWERLGVSATGSVTNRSVIRDGAGAGAHMATNCGGPCSPGQCLYQDVPRRGLAGSFRFGGRFFAEGSGAVELVVFQRDAAARILARHSVPLAVGSSAMRVSSPAFPVHPSADHFRITVYLNTPSTIHFDDMWLARSGG